jgi:hypothetical protein
MPRRGSRLHLIIDDFGVETVVIAPSPLAALRLFHGEAMGNDRGIRIKGNQLIFKRPAHQALCAGTWRVTRYCESGRFGPETIIEIPEPSQAL